MGKKILSLVLLVMMLGSLAMFQGYASYNWGSTVNLGDVTIGVILPDWNYNQIQTTIFKLAEQDINSKLLVSGATAHFTFDIKVVDDQHSHQYWVDYFHTQQPPVDLIIGGYYSSQAGDSLSYINDNHMLLFSPSSTDTGLTNPDGLFRMCANDRLGTKPLVDMISSRGIQHVVILYTPDWAYDYMVTNYLNVDHVHKIDIVPFNGGSENTALSQASSLIKYYEKAAILVLGSWTDIDLYNKAMNYPVLNKQNWFGIDPNNLDIQLYAPSASAKLHLYSAQGVAPPEAQSMFSSLQNRVSAITDHTLNVYEGYSYDIAWVIAKSVLIAKSTTASNVINVLPNVSRTYLGVTGYCKLDANGDRANPYYNIMGYYLKDPNSSPLISYYKSYGYCEPYYNKVVWYSSYP